MNLTDPPIAHRIVRCEHCGGKGWFVQVIDEEAETLSRMAAGEPQKQDNTNGRDIQNHHRHPAE